MPSCSASSVVRSAGIGPSSAVTDRGDGTYVATATTSGTGYVNISNNTSATPTEMNRAGRLFGKFSNQRVKIVTQGPRGAARIGRTGRC